MAAEIAAGVVRTILQAVQDTSGGQYRHLLTEAGLARFIDNLPPDELTPLASREEIARLYQTIYAMLGEALTRLFLRNYGQLLAAKLLVSKIGQMLTAEAAAVPAPERAGWFVRRVAEVSEKVWTRQVVSEDEQAWYWTSMPCPLCVGISGATAPICASPESLYSTLARHIIGQRLRVVEVACRARGDEHCKYAFYKPAAPAAPTAG